MTGTRPAPQRLLHILFGIALGVCSLAADARAFAAEVPNCTVPANVEELRTLRALPQPLQDAIHARLGRIAEPGEPYNATDVVDLRRPSQQLVFVWHGGSRWVLALRQGGIALMFPVICFELVDGKARLLARVRPPHEEVCAKAAEMLFAVADGSR